MVLGEKNDNIIDETLVDIKNIEQMEQEKQREIEEDNLINEMIDDILNSYNDNNDNNNNNNDNNDNQIDNAIPQVNINLAQPNHEIQNENGEQRIEQENEEQNDNVEENNNNDLENNEINNNNVQQHPQPQPEPDPEPDPEPEKKQPEPNKEDPNKKEEPKKEQDNDGAKPDEEKELQGAIDAINSQVNLTMFMNRLNTFNKMFKTGVDANQFIDSVTGAWELLQSEDRDTRTDGYVMLGEAFRNTLSYAFTVEEEQSYKEHRLPEYNEIITSANELLRVAMFTFTDMYSDPEKKHLFKSTICGGLTAKDMAALTAGESLWNMDQRSDKAWEYQSADAKSIAEQWLNGSDKPYEKLIEEMNVLVEMGKNSISESNRREVYNKLAAAEWMLLNNEKMMIESADDPLKKIPNWNNRYWKATVQAREALGIPKHISMRELIQGDYAASSKAITDKNYNARQIQDHVLDPEVRDMVDSMEVQQSEFTIQRESIKTNHPSNREENENQNDEPEADRYLYYVREADEIKLMKEAPIGKEFIVDKDLEKANTINRDYELDFK